MACNSKLNYKPWFDTPGAFSIQILKEGDEKALARSAKFHPRKLNQLLVEWNINKITSVWLFVNLVLTTC